MKKLDIIVIGSGLLILLAAFVFVIAKPSSNDSYVVVRSDGEIVYKEVYSKDLHVHDTIEKRGLFNEYTIEDGFIKMNSANCANQVCVMRDAISLEDYFLPIVCSPNNVVISIESSENEIDA